MKSLGWFGGVQTKFEPVVQTSPVFPVKEHTRGFRVKPGFYDQIASTGSTPVKPRGFVRLHCGVQLTKPGSSLELGGCNVERNLWFQ